MDLRPHEENLFLHVCTIASLVQMQIQRYVYHLKEEKCRLPMQKRIRRSCNDVRKMNLQVEKKDS